MQTLDSEPDWDHVLTLTVTPAGLIQALFATASSVHTGWSSCIESDLVVSEVAAADERSGNYVRLVEQEFVEDEDPDEVWHDWAVEVRVGDVFIVGHWQLKVSAPPLDWEWCTREAESAFDKASVLLGRRTRRIMAVEEVPEMAPPKSLHH